MTKTDIPRPSGLEEREVPDERRQVEQEVVAGSSPMCDEREQALLALLLEERRQRRERIAGLERSTRTGPGCRRRRRRSTAATPSASRTHARQRDRAPRRAIVRRAARLDRRTRRPRIEQQRVERDREGQRRPGQERGPGQQPDQQRPLPAPQLDQAGRGQDRRDEVAGVPDAAARRDPQDLGREPEQERPASRGRPGGGRRSGRASIQHSPTLAAARTALMPGSTWSALDGADDRDQRHEGDRRERRERARRTGRRPMITSYGPGLRSPATSGRGGTRRRGRRSRRGRRRSPRSPASR